MTKAHARRIEEIFDSLYPEYKGELAKVIVSEDHVYMAKEDCLINLQPMICHGLH